MQQVEKLNDGPVNIAHGFTDTHIALQFNRNVNQLFLTPKEAIALIDAIKVSMQRLEEQQQELTNMANLES